MHLRVFFPLLAFLTVFAPVYAKTGIIVPLYIYPLPGAWDPLLTAITAHPDIQFYIIANPNSGPGDANTQPNTDYQPALQSLRSHANVLLVGYVFTHFGARPLSEVRQDVLTYAGWQAAWSVAGIFFDETQAGLTSTYTSYVNVVRNATWPSRSQGYVILNPGVDIGNSDYYGLADQIVTFEERYTRYQALAPLPTPHPAQQSVIIHTFPSDDATLASVLSTLKTSGFASVYITNVNFDETTNVYGSFGSNFPQFVADVGA
ncbi:Spherulation-specific family 4 [Mycena rebaudengoi]|nr:Spherulation-specific family 4 [Mycena rebaudengoi]